jgi:TolB-like protein/DNA-binding winged helix-turn-helix (wHTH) protein/Flp pilus assembly protein TadD
MLEADQEHLRFGPFELDPKAGELRREGVVIPLPPQPFRLLVALASRPGQLVTRDELRRIVWGEDTFVDFDRGLNFCVMQARDALGDDAKRPAYIETLPKRGYRFVAAIHRPAEPLPERRRLHLAAVAAAASLLVVILVVVWQQGPVSPRGARLAVLPFTNASASGADAYLADGITEEVSIHLGRMTAPELRLVARDSLQRYRGDASSSIAAIRRDLGVRHVVTGSVRREKDRIRVTAHLIETASETEIWSESFERRGSEMLPLQQELAGRIAEALRLRLVRSTPNALIARSPEAHEAYLRGRHEWHAGKLEASAASLRESIRIEPEFVLSHLALAETMHAMAMTGLVSTATAADEIRGASQASMRLAPALAQTHSARGMLAFWYEWRLEEAEEAYRQAILLNPGDTGALHDHGWLLIARGAFEEGIAEIRRAQHLDPLSPRANTHVAWAYIYSRRYADAEREVRRALALQPGNRHAMTCLEQIALLTGRSAPSPASDGARPYASAARLAMAGDADGAIRWLAAARDSRDLQFVLAAADPKLESLHGDPRFQALLREIGLSPVRPARAMKQTSRHEESDSSGVPLG